MKRNKQSTKVMRSKRTIYLTGTNSKYARKVALGRQMYGPGCCGHPRSRK